MPINPHYDLLARLFAEARGKDAQQRLARKKKNIQQMREELLRKLLGLEDQGIPYERYDRLVMGEPAPPDYGQGTTADDGYAEDWDAEGKPPPLSYGPTTFGRIKAGYRR